MYLSFTHKVNPILVGHCFPLFVVGSFPLKNFKWVGVLGLNNSAVSYKTRATSYMQLHKEEQNKLSIHGVARNVEVHVTPS